jgi:hypothetical protein
VSLNNRISIRDAHEARGGVIDCQDVTRPGSSARSPDTVILEIEKPQKDFMKRPVAEAEGEVRVNGESCDRHVIVLLFMPGAAPATADIA